jgi:uncharacterized NAD-dependent epimerase/dehydratase family protein
MVADFISGAAEQLVLDHQEHEILVIEGQGSLGHPSYSGVTLGLLHGCQPHGMILCYEPGRPSTLGLDHLGLLPLEQIRDLFETMASIRTVCRVIGVSMNSRRLTEAESEREQARVREAFRVPVCDVFRHGPQELIEAVIQLKRERGL